MTGLIVPIGAVLALTAIGLLAARLWVTRKLLASALDIADQCLEHNEMGVEVAAEVMDEEEAQMERDWNKDQRANLASIREIARLS